MFPPLNLASRDIACAEWNKATIKNNLIDYVFIRMKLHVALTHQIRSYREVEAKKSAGTPKRKQRNVNDRKRTSITKISKLQPFLLRDRPFNFKGGGGYGFLGKKNFCLEI